MRELTALRAGGFEPVGQAFGTATINYTRQVFQNYQIHPTAYGFSTTNVRQQLGSARYGTLRVSPKLISG